MLGDVVELVVVLALVLNSVADKGMFAMVGEYMNAVLVPAIIEVTCIEKVNVPLVEVPLG